MHWRQYYAEIPTRGGGKDEFSPHTMVLWCFFYCFCCCTASYGPLGCLLVDEVALKLTIVLNLGRNGSCFNLANGFLHTSLMHVDSLSVPQASQASAFRPQRAPRRDNSDIDSAPPINKCHCQMLALLVFTLRKTTALIRHLETAIGCLLLA